MTLRHNFQLHNKFSAILLDMDGVLYHGNQPLKHAIDFMESIQYIPHCFITNNPVLLPQQIADKLETMGFKRPEIENIITSGEATALWLSEQKKSFHYFAIGAQGLHDALSKFGQYDEQCADYVIIGEGAGIDYKSLTTGINLIINHKAKLISTNPDITVDGKIDGKHVILPGGGTLVSPFITATGQQPITIGKPFPLLYEMAIKMLGVKAQDCLMIGDRPDTDINGAANLGMKTALVRTGRFLPNEPLPVDCQAPDWDTLNLHQLQQELSRGTQ
ncbi:MAG: HAD-IIA family hydrolase [Gammaproteobacteria bacterium]|nr:HAD-IIA family hydrolase [Gammaproteobacteria bacterium]